ncbi:mammalian cell entry protein [Mycolicibacter algericus]|uniref:Mce associated membrane protein n=1 Tax=Mycolicibacter algericus TaxID=1288388 RepID=A0A7I9YFI7_MYCAL|nr:mammalian cell entry protein [Mycolicibacter algericus]MDQ2628468.1 mammalian cell entry protein [Actinomycetota bacterium]GFG87425.1 Mce associated membrane protein [Mycolicibacter algericus]
MTETSSDGDDGLTEDIEATTTDDDGDGDGEPGDETDETRDGDESETAATKPRVRRRISLRVAGALASALFIASAAFAAGAAQPYLVDRAEVATKLDIARTAARAIHTLWNYTPENMDTLPDRAAVYLSGDLEAQYRKFIAAIAESNKQAKVTDTTEIVGAAVESLDGPEATVLVYTNTSATSELNRAVPSIKYLAYRLYMKREQNRWVVTRMPTITSLDLTPRFQS